ncbi:ABC transporter ATP-binding protein [Streptomyces sp. NPDC000594]|uniref:ABC transporter ATP-binding protein n=1 Tax=Streptomyces sp. NPDC000594 TaxID=3154261 RepID=UPI00333066F7
MTRAISLHNVSKSYGRAPRAVDRLTLGVAPGEFLALLGPSGCGKTTVLRLIAGLEHPTDGELLLDGEPAGQLAPGARDMAMVFQDFALYPTMTNRDNIGFPLRVIHPRRDPGPLVEATARRLGIEELLDRYPAQLSGGERQRVAMGRALSRRPSVLLLDEPLAHSDPKQRLRLRARIVRFVRETGATTLHVTHDQAEAMALGDRVAVLRAGVLQQIGPPRDIYGLPRNLFVATFVGTPRISLLQAVVHAPPGGGMALDLGGQRLPLPEPLSVDHQLLRIQQGRRIVVGLRSEAVRIALPSRARPGEVPLGGVVAHTDYQGHEALVHCDTGSRAAAVPEPEPPRPPRPRRSRPTGRGTGRPVRGRPPTGPAEAGRSGARGTGRPPYDPYALYDPEGAALTPGDLVVRARPDLWLQPGARVPLLVDLARLYVFDHHGRRVCPTPADLLGFDG